MKESETIEQTNPTEINKTKTQQCKENKTKPAIALTKWKKKNE